MMQPQADRPSREFGHELTEDGAVARGFGKTKCPEEEDQSEMKLRLGFEAVSES